MCTLTLSSRQVHDDRFIKRFLLTPFLMKLMKKHTQGNYMWKAEPQKNGNIHFHLLLDFYVPKEYVQLEWNITQSQYGYHKMLNRDGKDLGHNSTRIESLRDKNNGVAYAAKYVSKSEGDRPIKGRLWGCNDRLRELKPIEYCLQKNEVIEIIQTVTRQSHNIECSDYFCLVKYPIRWHLISDSYRLNYMSDLNGSHNINILTSTVFSERFGIQSTSWYQDVVKEVGEIHSLYLASNGLLFDGEDW